MSKKSGLGSQELFGGHMEHAPQAYLLAHVDGGARGNPGPAGYGVSIEDEAGRPIAQLKQYLGRQTNNYAEYQGLLAALRYAVEQGFKALKVRSDSELLVRQINGQYKVSNPALKELYGEARQLIRRLEYFDIQHVRREENREADRLANEAMGQGTRRASPAAIPAVPREANGVVRDGVVEFLGEPFSNGTRVKIRKVE